MEFDEILSITVISIAVVFGVVFVVCSMINTRRKLKEIDKLYGGKGEETND